MTASRIRFFKAIQIAFISTALFACTTRRTEPDKTIGGAVLGAAWGAGAGAVVGNQIHDNAGAGAAVGAGFGMASGAMAGYAQDSIEDEQALLEDELEAIRLRNEANRADLIALQARFDEAATSEIPGAVHSVFFDDDQTNMRAGAVANLEVLGEALKKSARATRITVAGHTDDTGDSEYNRKLSEARAHTVAAYLASRGISMDQIETMSFGSTRPVATNATAEGRQLNRRVEVYISR